MISVHDRRIASYRIFDDEPSDTPVPVQYQIYDEETVKPSKHARLRTAYRHLRISSDVRAKAGTKRDIERTPLDPELAHLVATVVRDENGRPLAAKLQPKTWLHARDIYAAKNQDLARRASDKQWQRNKHLEREKVKCCGSCVQCRKHSGYRWCQPDLEHLAYIGLLEAIRCFNAEKAGCISSYAVHTMKQSMMTLLRQTPVFYPQELLKDRRELVAEEKKLKRVLTQDEQIDVLTRTRKCRKGEELETRRQLAINCYYGQEKKSVEDLQQRYVDRADRSGDKRSRRSRLSIDGLIEQPIRHEDINIEDHDLSTALAALTPEQRLNVEKVLKGKAELTPETLDALRAEML